MSDKKVALIVGVGPGLGAALARRPSDAGLAVAGLMPGPTKRAA
jgi:NAD(P)-dependent dehydrogenase (short-subunit alcohol dehydrogenase family)